MLEYSPLNAAKEEIRLLTILTPRESTSKNVDTQISQPICCTLEHFSLVDYTPRYSQYLKSLNGGISHRDSRKGWLGEPENRSPNPAPDRYRWGDFNALSYTWGEQKNMHTININNKPFEVGHSLFTFLQKLRSTTHDPELRRKIWIDAICTNQKDVQECNVQVKRMKSIYGQARNVLVWLGEEADQSGEAFSFILAIQMQLLEDGSRVWTAMRENPQIKEYLRSLYLLLTRPYWGRVWIIQELAMGENTTRIMCGDKILSWEIVASTASLLASEFERQWNYAVWAENPHEASPKTPLQHIVILGLLHKDPPATDLDLEHLRTVLTLSQLADATNKRDKVYGILGLLSDEISSLVKPNYEHSIQEIYTEFAAALLQATKDPTFLFEASATELGNGSWPSWVPDWRTRSQRNIRGLIKNYHASGSSPLSIKFQENRSWLKFEGFKVTEITENACTGGPSTSGRQCFVAPISSLSTRKALALAVNKTLSFGIGCDDLDDPNETIMAIPWFEGSGISDLPRQDMDRWRSRGWEEIYNELGLYPFLLSIRHENRGFSVHGMKLKDLFPPKIERCRHPDDIKQSVQVLGITTSGRRMMGTRNGFLVLAPKEARSGDGVYIFVGCNVPIILRERGQGTFILIGECYVDGLMQGEGMEALSRRQYGLETITLI